MNKLLFSLKFVASKGTGAKRSKSVFLPVLGLTLGIIIILLTLAIMNGMEEEVFSKLRSFHAPAKLEINSDSPDEMENISVFLNTIGIDYYEAVFRNAVIRNGEDFKFISVIAVNNIENYAKHQLGITPVRIGSSHTYPVLIGNELGYMLNLSEEDHCELLSPVDINLASGFIPEETFEVTGIFNFDILNINGSYAIISLDAGEKLFSRINQEYLLLNNKFNQEQQDQFQRFFPSVKYISWEEEFESLVSAMKLEKIAYSFFGFIVIFISAFNLMSIMSMMVMRKIPQIGILMAMGMNSRKISEIFLIQAGLTVIAGGILGGVSTYSVIRLNEKYHLLKQLLTDFPLSNFPLIISWQVAIFVVFGAGVIILLAGLYPALKINKLNPVEAIDYIK